MENKIVSKRKVTSFELDADILLALKQLAKIERRSNASMITSLIMEEFKRRNLELPPKPSTS